MQTDKGKIMGSDLDAVVMQEIAEHAQTSFDHVKKVYEETLAALGKDARIHDFLPLLAMKKVRRSFLHATQHPAAKDIVRHHKLNSRRGTTDRLKATLFSPTEY